MTRLEAALAELVDALRAEVRADATPVTGAPDRLLSIDDVAGLLGIGRSAVYGELGAGRLRSIKVGRRRLVPGQAIAEFVAAAQSREPGAA